MSLLELLVASALGLLITMGVMTGYLGIKSNNNFQQVLSDLQDSGRFAQTILNQRIRVAGFVGCVDGLNPVDQNQAIIGYSSDHLPAFLQGQVAAGTDAVVVKSCISHSNISKDAALKTMAYYIGDTHRKNQQGQTILALFQKPADGEREELIAGVEQMQLLYGVLVDSTANSVTYYPAAQIVDWETVRSVQIDLLLNSIDAVLTKPQPYYFHGQVIAPSDLLLHKPWSTYVTLRDLNNDIGH